MARTTGESSLVNLYYSLASNTHSRLNQMTTLKQYRDKIAAKLGVRSRREIQKERYQEAWEVLKCFEDFRTANGHRIIVGLADAFGGRVITLESCPVNADETDLYRSIPKPFAYIYYGVNGQWTIGKWQHNNTTTNSSSVALAAGQENFNNLEAAIDKLTEYAKA